jgi:hypothetical protein
LKTRFSFSSGVSNSEAFVQRFGAALRSFDALRRPPLIVKANGCLVNGFAPLRPLSSTARRRSNTLFKCPFALLAVLLARPSLNSNLAAATGAPLIALDAKRSACNLKHTQFEKAADKKVIAKE